MSFEKYGTGREAYQVIERVFPELANEEPALSI